MSSLLYGNTVCTDSQIHVVKDFPFPHNWSNNNFNMKVMNHFQYILMPLIILILL